MSDKAHSNTTTTKLCTNPKRGGNRKAWILVTDAGSIHASSASSHAPVKNVIGWVQT